MKLASNLEFDPVDYANQGNSFIGIRGSGKTYGAMKTAEELMDAHIPIVVIDPTGVWTNLRIGINGNPGYPVIVVGGMNPDIPLEKDTYVETCQQAMHAALRTGASIVFDLKHKITATKAAWTRIVIAVVEILLEDNMQFGLRHVYIEEAAEFIPQSQSAGGSVVYARIETMARMGRNFGLGYTLMNQRAEEVAKAIFEISEQVFVFRQSGKNSLLSIEKWLDKRGIDKSTVNLAELPRLQNGECFSINEREEKKVQIFPKKTFHPDPKKHNQQLPEFVHTLDRKVLLDQMIGLMEMSAPEDKPVKKESQTESRQREYFEQHIKMLSNDVLELQDENKRLRAIINSIASSIATVTAVPETIIHKKEEPLADIRHVVRDNGVIAKAKQYQQEAEQVTQQLTKMIKDSNAGMRMLKACALFPKGINKKKMCLIAGISVGGSTYRQGAAWMRKKGLVTDNSNDFFITPEGKNMAGDVKKPENLVDFWKSMLPAGARNALIQLNKLYPNSITRNQLAGMLNYEPGGSSMRQVMAKLRKSGIIHENGQKVSLSPDLKI